MPLQLDLPFTVPPLLAAGAELKNCFCLAREQTAWLSDANGNMEYVASLARFETALAELQAQLGLTPTLVACDLHPGYHSTRWATAAAEARGLPLIKVQHHHAHVAAVMAEHGLGVDEQVIGVALDGTGYGTDGCIWGGEVLVAGYRDFSRAAYLRYAPLPGGDSAVRKPYRMALAHLWAAGIPWDEDLPPVAAAPLEERRILRRQLDRHLNTVPTSSMGRLFDAVSALIGVRQVATFEGEAAIELERCAASAADDSAYAFAITDGDWPLPLDPAPVLRALIADGRAGIAPALLSARFHAAVAQAIVTSAGLIRQRTGLDRVALSGGVFQNRRLLALVQQGLTAAGFTVLTHRQLAPNDSSLAFGQAVIAASQFAAAE